MYLCPFNSNEEQFNHEVWIQQQTKPKYKRIDNPFNTHLRETKKQDMPLLEARMKNIQDNFKNKSVRILAQQTVFQSRIRSVSNSSSESTENSDSSNSGRKTNSSHMFASKKTTNNNDDAQLTPTATVKEARH